MKTFDPFSGPWSEQNIRTLLNRTMFGYSKSQWNMWSVQSMKNLVDTVLSPQPLPDAPINKDFKEDPYVKIGETWVNAPYPKDNNDAKRFRMVSLISWLIADIVEKKIGRA